MVRTDGDFSIMLTDGYRYVLISGTSLWILMARYRWRVDNLIDSDGKVQIESWYNVMYTDV